MDRYGEVDHVVDLIRMGAVENASPGHVIIRELAIETVGYFADRFKPTQDALARKGLLPILVNELNRPQHKR